MKTGTCVHWNDGCIMETKCIFKKNGDCIKNGIIESREMVIDKLEKVGTIYTPKKYQIIRNM